MKERFRVVPAVYVLLSRGDEILLQLRQNTGYRDGHWATAAAGHVEAGESAFEAACREADEELGVTIRPADLVPIATMHRTHGNGLAIDERVDFFFRCQRWGGVPRRMEPAKAADLRWFPLGALPEPVVPHEKYLFGMIRDGHVDPILSYGFEAGARRW